MPEETVRAFLLTLPGAKVPVGFELVPNEQALQTGARQPLPVTMTADQARALGQALLKAAEATEMGQAPTQSRN